MVIHRRMRCYDSFKKNIPTTLPTIDKSHVNKSCGDKAATASAKTCAGRLRKGGVSTMRLRQFLKFFELEETSGKVQVPAFPHRLAPCQHRVKCVANRSGSKARAGFLLWLNLDQDTCGFRHCELLQSEAWLRSGILGATSKSPSAKSKKQKSNEASQ